MKSGQKTNSVSVKFTLPFNIEAIRISALKLKMLSGDDCVLLSSDTLILYRTIKAC